MNNKNFGNNIKNNDNEHISNDNMENNGDMIEGKTINYLFRVFSLILVMFFAFKVFVACQKDDGAGDAEIKVPLEDAETVDQIMDQDDYKKNYTSDIKIGDYMVKLRADNLEFQILADTLLGHFRTDKPDDLDLEFETEDYDVEFEDVKKSSVVSEYKGNRKQLKLKLGDAKLRCKFHKEKDKYKNIRNIVEFNKKIVFKPKDSKKPIKKYILKLKRNIAKKIAFSAIVHDDDKQKKTYKIDLTLFVDGLSIYEAKLLLNEKQISPSQGGNGNRVLAENKKDVFRTLPYKAKWTGLRGGDYKLVITKKYYDYDSVSKAKKLSNPVYFIKKEIDFKVSSIVRDDQKKKEQEHKEKNYAKHFSNKILAEKLQLINLAPAQQCIQFKWDMPILKHGAYVEYKKVYVSYRDANKKWQKLNDETFNNNAANKFDKKVCQLSKDADIVRVALERHVYKKNDKKQLIGSFIKKYYFKIKN